MIDHLIQLACSVSGLVAVMLILWRVEPALNRMTASTHWMIRYSMLLVAAGALLMLTMILAGTPPSLDTLLLAIGLAMLLLCERRLRFLVNRRSGDRHA
jgi:uncharacterized membrane-anchored protein